MTLQELQQLASLGEGVSLEFKRRVPRPERIAKEVVALANTRGGRLLLGVSDDGEIVGLDDVSEEAFLLRRALETCIEPPVAYTTERIVVAPRRDVILVEVPESDRKPHHLVKPRRARRGRLRQGPSGDGTAYVRVEEMSVEASPESVAMMEHDEASAARVEFGENESLLMRYLNDYGRITVAQFARLADIPPARASATLTSFTKANILRLHADRDEDFFTLAY
jgi:predicted HTH transcriptional regulator